MELYKEILMHALAREEARVTFPDLALDARTLVEGTCYQALARIREILRDDSLSDRACYEKIEAVVTVLEDLGSGCGDRHDF